jgi:leukotriene-A4 hydrolase
MKFPKLFLLSLATAALLPACSGPETELPDASSDSQDPKPIAKSEPFLDTMTIYPFDPHSYSQPNQVLVTHLNLQLSVNFSRKELRGYAEWFFEKLQPDATELILDASGLNIEKIVWPDGSFAGYKLTQPESVLGERLSITLKPGFDKVRIFYHTDEEAAALQWLAASQTYDKNFPFLFTQSQAILARTWLPCQDSPGIRFTYNADIETPIGLMALMSAVNPQGHDPKGRYSFKQPIPIPAYLMALTVGDYTFKNVGPRTGVYAERGMIDKAVSEFKDMEDMLNAAEALYGPYEWLRYDVAVMPPSFPFGGMENPMLTFATPTIISGDRSLVSLIAHELAHSWSGNLVTNATWNDFWLNEGFTVYFENRIMESVYGREYSEMLAHLSWQDLQDEVRAFLKTRPDDTRLKLDLTGRNPDDGVSAIAYDKGYFFLRLIEETTGRERFDNFLKTYFGTFRFRSMDTETFLEYLKTNLLTDAEMKEIGVQQWVYERGLPLNCPKPIATRFERVEQVLEDFGKQSHLPKKEVAAEWSTHEWLHFINNLPANISREQLASLDRAFGLTKSNNAEITSAWLNPVIRARYKPAYPKMEKFLHEVGRRKFLMPAYRSLIETGQRDLALAIYKTARNNYHAVSRQSLDKLLDVEI